jgi:hypothetical protein
VRRPPAAVSPPAGAVTFRVPDVAVLFEAAEGAWARATAAFLAAVPAVDAVVTFRDTVDRTVCATVVPDDVDDETLPLRSPWRVAGRDRGERTDLGPPVAALFPGRVVCAECGRAGTAPLEEPGRLAEVDLSGLDGFNGDIGRDR